MQRKILNGVYDLTNETSIITDEGVSNTWVKVLQNQVNTMHNAIYYNGSYGGNSSNASTAKQLMTGGFYLNAGQILSAVNLQDSDNRLQDQAVAANYMTGWFENLLITNLINYWYKSNSVFIVYIPYGPVKGLNQDNSWESFTRDNCVNDWINGRNWLTKVRWNDTVVADCLDNGMAVLANAGSTMMQPSFYEIANMTYNNITYSPYDMIQSSLNGFFKYGYK